MTCCTGYCSNRAFQDWSFPDQIKKPDQAPEGKAKLLRIFVIAICGFLGLALSVLAPVHAQESPDVPVIGPATPSRETPAVIPPSALPTVPGAILEGVVVQGNQRVEPETIVSYMSIRQGDAFGVNDINESLKRLFATGLFADVAVRREGNFLIVRVVENPIINRIAFEGNLRIDDDVLGQEVQLRPRGGLYAHARTERRQARP